MAIYAYMKESTISRKSSECDTSALQSVVTDLKTKIESLNRQLSDIQSSRSTTRRVNKHEDFDFEEEKSDKENSVSNHNASNQIQEHTKKSRRQSQECIMPIETAETLCAKGDRLFFGHGTEQNYQKAMDCYKEAMVKGSGKACAAIARMYENGQGIEKNVGEAYSYFKQGAEMGDVGCIFAMGKYHEKKMLPKDEPSRGLEDAVSFYERAASENFPEALTKLGYMHEQGIHYVKDAKKAMEYYEKAANLGDALALNYVGLYLYKEQKYKNAVELFKKSKDLGCTRGANNLGLCYEQGLGVEQDLEFAIKCYKESAEKKYPQAMFNLGYLFLRKAKTTESVEEFEECAYWLRAAISEDATMAEPYFYLGFLFEKGLGVNYDLRVALGYYKEAGNRGYVPGIVKCGEILYERSELLGTEKEEGIKFYEMAAEKGDETAKEFLEELKQKQQEITEDDFENEENDHEEKPAVLGESNMNISKGVLLDMNGKQVKVQASPAQKMPEYSVNNAENIQKREEIVI